jgi:hypothetical protein
MHQCDRVAVRGFDRHGLPAGWNAAGEADGSGARREDGSARLATDVDAPVLARFVRVGAEEEGLQYRPVGGPGPGESGRRADLDREQGRKQNEDASHDCSLLVV